jgi:hypothetical protein
MPKMLRSSVIVAMAVGIIALAAARDTTSASYAPYNLHGTYRLTFTGFVPSVGRLQSGIGIFVLDGTGHLSGTEVFTAGATVCRNVAVAGTYTLGTNGIGDLSADLTSPTAGCSGHFNTSLLVLDGGDLVRAISTDPNFVTISEEWRRQPE